jgi:NarL family two-component system response regulator LiaR
MSAQVRIRILIADAHAVVREGLRALIEAKPDMELVGEAENGLEAVSMARSLKPDVILLDLMMPRMDCIEAISEIKRENPNARILVLTSFAADDKVFPAVKAGALGYLLKGSPSQALIEAIREIFRGESSLHPAIARKLIREFNRPSTASPAEDLLTKREVAVLKLIAGGYRIRRLPRRWLLANGW